MTSTPDAETPAEHLRHAISDALRQLDIEAEHRNNHRFAGAARAILRGQLGDTGPLARLTEVEQERDVIRDRYDEDVHDFWGLNEKAKDAEARAEAVEQERDELEERRNTLAGQVLRYETQGWASTLGEALKEAEKRLRRAEEWIQEVDHVEDCAAFGRLSSRECDCGRTAILKREGSG